MRRTNGKQPAIGELTLKFSPPLMESLAQMAELASSKRTGIPEIQSYVIDLVEAQIAEFRCRRIPADFLCRNDKTPIPEVGDNIKPRGKLSPDDKERIIEQRGAGVSIPELAVRWHCGASSIRRALQRAKKKRALPSASPEVVQKIIFLNGQKYDTDDKFIETQTIAEKCNVPECVVSAVLSNHKPVTPSSSAVYGRKPGGWLRNMSPRG
jgi:hypothetical protein